MRKVQADNFSNVYLPRKDTSARESKKYKVQQIPITKNIIHIFTDGSTLGNPGWCGAGAVLIYNNYRKELSTPLGFGTSNIAELMSIKLSLEEIEDKEVPIIIYTDSRYCIGMLACNWNAKKNAGLILEIKDFLKSFHMVKFKKVKGHSGIIENEKADELAGQASLVSKSQGEKKHKESLRW